MSEAMTSELIVEALWILKKYWTKVRFPYKKGNNWSDIDILAYNPETKHLVISESKVRGPKERIFAYTEFTKEKQNSIFAADNNYLEFIDNLKYICQDKVVFDDFQKMVKKITIQLVSNYIIDSSLKDECHKEILAQIRSNKNTKKYLEKIKIEIDVSSTLDIIAQIIEAEKSSGQGRRYGNPVLDIAREINRYLNPKISRSGNSAQYAGNIKKQCLEKFYSALNIS